MMECQSSNSKTLLNVFDASKRNRTRKKDTVEDHSGATDESVTSVCQTRVRRVESAKGSFQNVSAAGALNTTLEMDAGKRERDSSPSESQSPNGAHWKSRSSQARALRRTTRDGISLALKAGLLSTSRSVSPLQNIDVTAVNNGSQDQDSYIYAFLEEAIKKDKKKQRHSHHHEERRKSRDCDDNHRHHRRRRDDLPPSREHYKSHKEKSRSPSVIDQTMLLETFAKLCAQLSEKTTHDNNTKKVLRSLSHKSLQCEDLSTQRTNDNHNPVKHGHSRENMPTIVQSRVNENFRSRVHSHDNMIASNAYVEVNRAEKCDCRSLYNKENTKYLSTLDTVRSKMYTSDRHMNLEPEKSRMHAIDKEDPKYMNNVDSSRLRTQNIDRNRYRDYSPEPLPIKNSVANYRPRIPDQRDYYDEHRERCRYDDDKRRHYEQKTSRSFDVQRDGYVERIERSARSETVKDRNYDRNNDERYQRHEVQEPRDKYYDERPLERRENNYTLSNKDRRLKRNLERFDRNSIVSKDDDYRDRYSERERDSGLSVADGETSTLSGRSNCLKVVKQEIAEQREAMDKMMKLWKELMRCFKGIQSQGPDKDNSESAANARDSAAAQLRLWRECMRRYETVARDVGDTDARLMEEINKQRSEMAEMASMWQECLQRYRDMSNDFNSLKQQLTTSDSPSRHAPPLVCAEGEGTLTAPAAPTYRVPTNYPPMPPMAGYPGVAGSPLRQRASAPPAPPPWWWCGEDARVSPRRRSSPESLRSRDRDRDRDHRHRHKERDTRDDTRYKEKSSKPGGARSEHRRRKR